MISNPAKFAKLWEPLNSSLEKTKLAFVSGRQCDRERWYFIAKQNITIVSMKRRRKTLVMSTDKTTHRPTALARANLSQAKKTHN